MEDEERQKKLEAGKAKLAEYRQRKAHADSQKHQKKKKKKKAAEDSEGDSQGRVEGEPDQSVGGEEISGQGRDASQEGNEDPPTNEFTFARTLRSGETVKHNQTYTIEPESEVSTTAEDYSSEVNGCHEEMTESLMMPSKDFVWEEVEPLRQVTKGGTMEEELAAKTQAVEELSRELEDIRSAFGTEGIQQLQDFEAALKQRDGIITQLTANLQQAREEKDETMKEFLELTEQSQKLHIQFQQLQAGETLRNTSHSSTAADLLQARQQLMQYQPQLEELQLKLSEMETLGRRSEESFIQRINGKDLLIAEQDKVIMSREQSLTEIRTVEKSFAQTLKEKTELTAIITEQERSLTLLREELIHVARTTDDNIIGPSEKDLIIAEHERVISERDYSLTQLEDELESSEKHLCDLKQRMAAKEAEFERCMDEQKERMSSNEIMQLMGTVEDLQKRNHQGSLSEGDTIQQMQEKNARNLEILRAELDEMYGEQIVQMKQAVNLQHAAKVEQMVEQHRAELELLKSQQLSQSSTVSIEVETLNSKTRELQETLQQSQAMQDNVRHQLSQVTQEKFNLQAKVEGLFLDLRSAKEQVEQVSKSLISQESHQGELQRLQEQIDNLNSELDAAQEAAEEAEIKHESETTNYKIKLDMLEREKDAVLDRMAESQESELERLRTQLLFSHEEELTMLKEDLQREGFLNTENLLNEAAIKHQKALDDLRKGYEEELHLLRRERSSFATERDELFHQILGLKEDLKMALHSSKADKLVQQLQELQVEIEELRKGGEERVRMGNEIQSLLKKTELLENQTREKERCWENKWKDQESEKETLTESNHTLKEELDSKHLRIETLTAENNQKQQQVVQFTEEIEKQKTTFSFAEKNFEVNYQELKEEYTCLIEAKTQLEERTLKETLEFEANISSLQSQIGELKESISKRGAANTDRWEQAVIEKDTTELMEKLNVTLSEKESLAARLSEVTEKLMFTASKVTQLEKDLLKVRQENVKVIAQTESERDSVKQTFEIQNLSLAPSPAAVQSVGEGPVAGPSLPLKPTASGSNRRKRRQKSKQERKLGSAEQEMQPQMESQVLPCSRERAGKEDSTDGHQGDGGTTRVSRHGTGQHTEPDACQEAEEEQETTEHGECRLQMEAQRLSLSQIHSAQIELQQEDSEHRTHTLELKLQNLRDNGEDEPKIFKYHNMLQAVSEECSEIIQSFGKMFGEEFLESVATESQTPSSVERPETSESTSVVQEARELYRGLQQARERIEQEHHRLSQLQDQLRAEGNKMTGLQVAYDELKSSSEKQISDLRGQVSSSSPSTNKVQEVQRLKAEEQQKQLQLEESHRQELERLRAHYQQQAAESEERYAIELFMLQQRLQEVSGTQTPHSAPDFSSERMEEYGDELKDLCEGELSEGGVELRWPVRSAGLTAQLQALRKALYHNESLGAAGLEDRQHWERVEEEVAKAIVQMSVEFAQKIELARINKPWLEEVEKEKLERELEDRNAEIRKLKEELRKTESAAEQDDGESTERIVLRKANEKLCQVLVDVLKTTAAAEETMGLHMQSLHEASSGGQQAAPPLSTTQRETWQRVNTEPGRPYAAESCQESGTAAGDVTVWSGDAEAHEGLEVSQQMMESLLLGAGTQLENEECLMGISSRLQTALEKMLMAITDTTNELQ
ncbi:A-kinase anchor protein 9 [Dissostichus eleginoides]|uniref:A-kinase anchor protein 9 n=1 Tax=Dissostichus eleginoides TaxID=100907 RepID=A0AAD9EVS2_DISEL|nr:A-kinase anchor protein 9 [Dissostichus eleginoides]